MTKAIILIALFYLALAIGIGVGNESYEFWLKTQGYVCTRGK